MRYAHACVLLSCLLCVGEAFSNAAEGYAQGKSFAQSLVPQGVSSPDVVPGFQGADVPEAHLSVGELEERAKERLSKAAAEVASGDSAKLSAEGMILDSHLNKKYFPPSSFEELLKTSDEIVQDPTKVLNAEVEERPAKVVTKTTQETCEESAPPFLLEDTSFLTHVAIAEKKKERAPISMTFRYNQMGIGSAWGESNLFSHDVEAVLESKNGRGVGYSSLTTEFPSINPRLFLPNFDAKQTFESADQVVRYLSSSPWAIMSFSFKRDAKEDELPYAFMSEQTLNDVFEEASDFLRRVRNVPVNNDTQEAPLSPWEKTSKEDVLRGQEDLGDTRDTWSTHKAFESLVDSGVCHYAGEECTQGPQTRVIAGAPVTRACWAKKRKYRCQFPSRNTCEELRQRGCTQLNSSCTKKMGDACAVYTQTYACRQVLTKPGRTRIRGKVPFCLDGSCHKVSYAPNQDMMEALSKLAALKQVAQDMDANARTVFKGEALGCGSHCASFSSCCGVSGGGWGVSLGLSSCSENEKKLAKMRGEGKCILTGTYCAEKVLGVCVRKKTNFCCFGSKLARVFHEEARRQLGMGFGSAKEPACQGLTFEQLASVDFEKIDLREVFSDLMARVAVPNPEALTRNFQQDWQARLPKAPSPQDPTSSPMGESIAQAKARQAPYGQDKTTNHTHISRDNTPEEHHELQSTNNLVF